MNSVACGQCPPSDTSGHGGAGLRNKRRSVFPTILAAFLLVLLAQSVQCSLIVEDHHGNVAGAAPEVEERALFRRQDVSDTASATFVLVRTHEAIF